MIHIDTEGLKESADLLAAANRNITQALSLLNQITDHNDWGCKERYQINEWTQNNRALLQQIQSDMESFVATTHSVADEFVETEKEIRDLFPSVEGLIARILTIPTTVIDAGSRSAVWRSSKEIILDQAPKPIAPPVEWPTMELTAVESVFDFKKSCLYFNLSDILSKLNETTIGVCKLSDLNL